jgi:heavy metal translocating P-type ATPase
MAVGLFILVAAHLSFKRAFQGLKEERKVNVDFLDALAVTLHSLEGFLVGPAMMITMIEGGEAVRDATQRTALSANTDLLASLQTDVNLICDGGEKIIPASQLIQGDRIALYPGDQIPVDGVIESGEGSLEVVRLTGESVPRHAVTGDEVLAGFILLEGFLIVETHAVGKNTRIGQITSMIESAPVFDTRVGNVAGRIANHFVLPTLALAGLSLLLSAGNIAQAASLLMFDLGTGLRVSVPTAIMAALSRAGSQGLLIRSGRALEQLVDLDVVVFDKTGTLTEGLPSVVHVDVVEGEDLNRLMQLAASAEQSLNHPVAKAIIKHGECLGMNCLECDDWDYRIGRGVTASIDGHAVLVGNAKLLSEEGLTPPSQSEKPELETATPVYLVVDGRPVATIYAADALRSDSRRLIAELHRRGIQAHMLTGDVASVAHAVAKRLGLAPEEVHAEALPDEKALLVKRLAESGHKVAFVGDGINDSAALAYADVSISFASGSDLARETADIVLTNDRVSDLLIAQDLARETFNLVNQNIGIVGVPNLSALVLGTFLPVSPIAAVLLNNGSCLVAAANAMRVLGFQPKAIAEAPPLEHFGDRTKMTTMIEFQTLQDLNPS